MRLNVDCWRIDRAADEKWALACATVSKSGLLDERHFSFTLNVQNGISDRALIEEFHLMLVQRYLVSGCDALDVIGAQTSMCHQEDEYRVVLSYFGKGVKDMPKTYKFRLKSANGGVE